MPNDIRVYATAASRRVHDWQPGQLLAPKQGVSSMSALIHPKTITVDGLSVRYAEGGQDGPDAILMSPWPESVYTPSSRPGRASRPPRT